MNKYFRSFCVLVVVLGTSASAQAALSPLGLSLIAPVQLPPADFVIAGARASVFWGRHRSVFGFDFGGLGNMTENEFVGIGVSGLFNHNRGSSTILGLQLAGAANINVNKASVYGLQASVGINWNQAESKVVGFQFAGLANLSPYTKVIGVQASLYNRAQHVYGFQIGVVNVAEHLHGVQIGLLNFNRQGLFAVSPFLNVGF